MRKGQRERDWLSRASIVLVESFLAIPVTFCDIEERKRGSMEDLRKFSQKIIMTAGCTSAERPLRQQNEPASIGQPCIRNADQPNGRAERGRSEVRSF
jgi:hypothetical protein